MRPGMNDNKEMLPGKYELITDQDDQRGAAFRNGESESPAVRQLDQILLAAIRCGASDIHLEPMEDRLRVRLRCEGELKLLQDMPRSTCQAIIARIKVISGMDIAEKRRPQDGRVQMIYKDQRLELRISSVPVVHGEKVVLRLLRQNNIGPGFSHLGMSSETQRKIKELLKCRSGLIVFTGPTGSGKTTSLYAVLSELNQPNRNLVTIEDPVEYLMPGVNQIPVNNKAGLSFASGLRSILRQDPDIIMIGEIRDEETASIAVRAALTGHLVLSTLHTSDAAEAVIRLLDMGVKPYLLAAVLLAAVGQRLVRLNCPGCRQSKIILEEECGTDIYKELIGEERAIAAEDKRNRKGLSGSEALLMTGCSTGCEQCGFTGRKGRTGIFELLTADEQMRELIKKGGDAAGIRRLAASQAMRTMRQEGWRKVLAGDISWTEVLQAAH